ncbi:hypothetical protein [Roseovarius sp.]|uniref:hypothetical protein n=1 Tax=Roseovarius sp. TaxID=1486281 RepID=UPI003BACA5A1
MPSELDYDPNIQRYQRMPQYQLEEDRGSGWQIWALVVLIAGGALFLTVLTGFGPDEQTGTGTEPAVSAPADGEEGGAVPQSVMEADGQ